MAKNYTVIVYDLRRLGDSSKPVAGFGGRNTAEDIYQLIFQLGFDKIFFVSQAVGAKTICSFTAAHPNTLTRSMMEFAFPGFLTTGFEGVIWWFDFHQTPNVSDALTDGKEREYLSRFYRGLAYNPEAITEDDIDKYASRYSGTGIVHAALE